MKNNEEPFKLSFGDIIDAIAKYPKMYLLHGSFGEALAFLEGYANGRRLGPSSRSGSFFNPYKAWLSTRLALSDTDHFWQRFLEMYSDEETALRQFATLWHEYEAESKSESPGVELTEN